MTPKAAIEQLVAVIVGWPVAGYCPTVDQAFEKLVGDGMEPGVAERVCHFAQIAWGQVAFRGVGFNFSDQYACLGRAGEVIERGALADEPYFRAALQYTDSRELPEPVEGYGLFSSQAELALRTLNAKTDPRRMVFSLVIVHLANY